MTAKYLIGNHVRATNANAKTLRSLGIKSGYSDLIIEEQPDYLTTDVFQIRQHSGGTVYSHWWDGKDAEGRLMTPYPKFKLN